MVWAVPLEYSRWEISGMGVCDRIALDPSYGREAYDHALDESWQSEMPAGPRPSTGHGLSRRRDYLWIVPIRSNPAANRFRHQGRVLPFSSAALQPNLSSARIASPITAHSTEPPCLAIDCEDTNVDNPTDRPAQPAGNKTAKTFTLTCQAEENRTWLIRHGSTDRQPAGRSRRSFAQRGLLDSQPDARLVDRPVPADFPDRDGIVASGALS
jgi:hypothetical protein